MDQTLTLPLTRDVISQIHAGDCCTLTGTLYTARDAAHKRMIETIADALSLPVEELLKLADGQAGSSTSDSGKTISNRTGLSDEQIEKARRALPFDIADQTIYYLGPTPAREGQVIGSAGPTTSTRMDRYSPILLDIGLAGMIGKGRRSPEVIAAMQRNTAVYFAATGGAGALLSKCIKSAEVIAYDDLGTEAIRKLTVEKLPVIAVIDCAGNNQYE